MPAVAPPRKETTPAVRSDDGLGNGLGWDSQVVLYNDCQTHSDHMERFGAAMMPRAEYLRRLSVAVKRGREMDWKGILP